jgi:hypothetical protein
MGYQEDELMRTNTNLSAFTEETTETKGVLLVELIISSKTLPTAFFVVDVKGRYNLLLGRDWIHANGCVPSTLHQCLIQWVENDVEVVPTEELVYIASAEAAVDPMDGVAMCLSGRDLSEYDYISVGKDGLIPVNIKPTFISANMSQEHKDQVCYLVQEFSDCFAWSCTEMPSLSRDLVEHTALLREASGLLSNMLGSLIRFCLVV